MIKIILLIVGIILLAGANIGGVGYGLYLWGGTGIALGTAAWTAFKFWLVLMGTGIISLVISLFVLKD